MKFLGFELKREEARAAGVEQGNGTKWLANILEYLNGPKSAAGIAINEDKALTIGAVYTAVRIIGGTVASLPLHVYRRGEPGGRELALRHWAYPLLHDSPNEYHTAYTWREMMMAHLLLWGDSFNRIEWLGNGSAGALYPLMPWDVDVKLTSKGVKYYQVRLSDGREDLPDDEMLHVPGLSYDGLRGLSVIGKMRDALGLAKAAENLASSFFANGAKPGWNLVVPSRMSETAQKNLAASIQERFAGKDQMGILVTEEGSKLVGPLQMPFKDAQFVEIRKSSRSEIFGWYGVPPHLGGDTERSTSWGTGIEQQDIGYAKHTITPWCVRIEQEINRKLFRRSSGMYAKFNMDALVRGDFKSLMEGLQIAIGRPFLTGNEGRELLDWNRSTQPDMDQVALPLNTGAGAPKKPGGSNPAGDGTGDEPSPAAGGEGNSARLVRETGAAVAEAIKSLPAPVINTPVTVNHQGGEVKIERQGPDKLEFHHEAGDVHIARQGPDKLEANVTGELKQTGRSITRYETDEHGGIRSSVTEHRPAGE